MPKDKIAIICDGKEISYGINLKHLFSYKNDIEQYHSSLGNIKDVEIYTPAVFKRERNSLKTTKVYIGSDYQINENCQKVLDCFGMNIYEDDNLFIVCADPSKIASDEYNKFIIYANGMRNKYIEVENQYFSMINSHDHKWVCDEFIKVKLSKLFVKKYDLQIKKQQYDCLSYILYLQYLRE